jgi:hypothetical protein
MCENAADNRSGLNDQGTFGRLDAADAAAVFERLHERVTRHCGRIEIIRRESGATVSAVLISKAELDSLEEAIEILSNTDSAAAMRSEVLRVASDCLRLPQAAAR